MNVGDWVMYYGHLVQVRAIDGKRLTLSNDTGTWVRYADCAQVQPAADAKHQPS